MIPSFAKVHNKFRLNNQFFSHWQLNDVAYSFVKEGKPFENNIGNFLLDWLDDKDFIYVKTSGSTGKPKTIKINKQAMVNSAIATGNYFNLQSGDSALHCLPTQFIAGKMMLVRAIILGLELDLVEPSLQPLLGLDKQYDFCAMVPIQLQNSIQELQNIKTLIVGGAHVSNSILEKIKNSATKIYATYGMTETITHIAVKQLNCKNDDTLSLVKIPHFNLLPDITISQDSRDCLVIEAPKLSEDPIITNDVVKLHSKTEFEVLGRYDNVINSGGIKLFPEQIEAKLSGKLKQRFFITSESDEVLGEKLILILEGESKKLPENIFKDLDIYERPKEIYFVKHFVETLNRKLKRLETARNI